MSIKKVKPTSKTGYKQGYYKPIYESKYIGSDPIIYRSSWERKFCHWCDHNVNVLHWISEPFSINYFNVLDKKYHKYYPDFYVKLKENSSIVEYLVEIKPKAQLQKPKFPKRKTKKAMKNFKYAYETYVRNLCKIGALNEMARKRNFKVMLLTEESNLF